MMAIDYDWVLEHAEPWCCFTSIGNRNVAVLVGDELYKCATARPLGGKGGRGFFCSTTHDKMRSMTDYPALRPPFTSKDFVHEVGCNHGYVAALVLYRAAVSATGPIAVLRQVCRALPCAEPARLKQQCDCDEYVARCSSDATVSDGRRQSMTEKKKKNNYLFTLRRRQGRGPGGAVVRLLASHQGKPGSIPGRFAPGFSHVGIMPGDAASRWVFSWVSRFRPPPPALAFRAALYSPRFTLIGSQDLDVKDPPRSLHSTQLGCTRSSRKRACSQHSNSIIGLRRATGWQEESHHQRCEHSLRMVQFGRPCRPITVQLSAAHDKGKTAIWSAGWVGQQGEGGGVYEAQCRGQCGPTLCSLSHDQAVRVAFSHTHGLVVSEMAASVHKMITLPGFVNKNGDSSAGMQGRSPIKNPPTNSMIPTSENPGVARLGIEPVIDPAPSFRRSSIFTYITFIGSQGLAVKRRPNLFTHSFIKYVHCVEFLRACQIEA
ncbi:hypothetical protein PR048_022907 [Dryococelus australis]|uniref:Uncharacterized protein n=1 Tax=Dryococelus australis TaxID=614101 RepID=A0ABQ9GSM6_9NEOP|nr:hypothetical protein PR048_022907 [Dryococelus australis]